MNFDFKLFSNWFKQKFLTDIRFWILLFFALRLYGITNAPLETEHNWRQAFTNMVARNFLEVDNNILYPRIDVTEGRSGIVASEFPLFNYLIYLFAKVFGYQHWYGRLINLMVASFGIYYFYKTIKHFFSKPLAFYSALFLLSSIWFAYSRKSMPDTFSMALVMIGLYHGLIYCYNKKPWSLAGFIAFSSLGILCKIPAIYLLSVFIIPLLDKKVETGIKVKIAVGGVIILTATYLWYFYWVPFLLSNYGVQLFFPRGFTEGIKELIAYFPDTLEKFYFAATESFLGFFAFLIGGYLMFRQKIKLLIRVFCITTVFFILFMIKTGMVFSVHGYYVVPYVPVMVLIAALAVTQIKNNKLKIAIAVLIVLEGVLNQQHDFRINPSNEYKLTLEAVADKISDKNDLFVINGGHNSQEIYFLHRKGWTVEPSELNADYLETVIKKGCRFLVIDKNKGVFHSTTSEKIVYADENFVVYRLKNYKR